LSRWSRGVRQRLHLGARRGRQIEQLAETEAAAVEQIERQQGRGRPAGRSEGGVSSTTDGEMMAAVIEPLAETEAAACRATYEVTAARVPK
jgi:hypothetical protein